MNKILFLIIIISSIPITSFACECNIIGITNENVYNYQDQYIIRGFKEADFIFYGKVVGFLDKKIEGYSEIFGSENPHYLKEQTNGYFPVFDLINTYKGKNINLSNKEIKIYQDWSLCDMGFEKDKKYVVFGYLDLEGKLRTSICAPNKIINSKIDLRKIIKYSN